jgi:hypothetical protein
MKPILKIVLQNFIFLFFGSNLFAQAVGDYRSFASGTWATLANWERWNGAAWINPAPSAPTSTDGVITIQSGHTIQITANVSIDQVIINTGGTINWTAGTCTFVNGTGVDLQIDGTFWDNRGATTPSITFTASTWQMGANGTLIRSAGNSSNNWQAAYQGGIATIPSTSNWILRKTTGQNPVLSSTTPASGSVYPNLTLENNTSTAWSTASFSGTTAGQTIKGNLDIGGSGTGSGVITMPNTNTFATKTIISGNMTIRSTHIYQNNGTGIDLAGNLTVNGTISYSGGAGLSNLTMSGGNAQTISGTGTLGIYSFNLNKSANNVTLNRAITIDNLFTLTSGLMISTAANLPTLNTNASVTGTSNASFVSGPIRYIGNAALTFPVGKGIDYQPLGISASAAGGGPFYTENFNSGGVGWTLNVVTGAEGADPNFFVINDNETGVAPPGCGLAGGGDPSLHVTSVFFPSGGAAYDAGGLCGFFFCPQTNRRTESPTIDCSLYSNINVSFDYIEGGATTIDNATLWYFDGTTWSQIDDMPKTIVCGSGQGQWTNRSVALPASANNNPLVKIAFRWVNNDDGAGSDPSFAVDDVTLSVAGPVSDFTCEYFYNNPQVPYGNVLATTLDHISNCEYWILDRNAGTENKFVTLNWDGNSCAITPLVSMRVARYDGISTWQDEGNSATTGAVAAGSVTSNLVTSFSPFTLGSTVAVVLPVELLEFNAKAIENTNVRLTWTTVSEISNERFEVERSKDGEQFEHIGIVKGAGNSVTQNSYVYTDLLPYSETSYYRLKQVNFDGKFSYTPLRPVRITGAQNIQIYPNPNNGNELFLNIENLSTNELSVFVTDITGKTILNELSDLSSGNSLKMVFPQKLASGTYVVNVKTAQKAFTCRLIVN